MRMADQFAYLVEDKALRFYNGDVKYVVKNNEIVVTISGKVYHIKAIPTSIKGSMTKLNDPKLENVTIKKR